ncbi:MAG: hypothetical protein R3A80_05625 [Bdellovibrionota bacterium]
MQGNPSGGLTSLRTTSFRISLNDAVSFDKGCYMGQETVARGTFRGKVNKSFCRITSDKILSRGEILTPDGTKVGSVRSVLQNKGTGIAKFNLNEANTFLINGETHTLKIEHLVNEETFRKGR